MQDRCPTGNPEYGQPHDFSLVPNPPRLIFCRQCGEVRALDSNRLGSEVAIETYGRPNAGSVKEIADNLARYQRSGGIV